MALPTPPISPAFLESLVTPLDRLLVLRYFGASALTLALYDHLLTLPDELDMMWSREWDLPRALFFLVRYGVAAFLLYLGSVLSGFESLDLNKCKTFIDVCTCGMFVLGGATQVYAIHHHYYIWDRQKKALAALVVASLVSFLPAMYLGLTGMLKFRETIVYIDPPIDVCIYPQPSFRIIVAWSCLASFDVMTIAIVAMNSLHRPYRESVDIILSLRKDGVLWFFVLFVLRVINAITLGVTPAPDTFVVSFHVWALVSVVQSRFILRTAGVKGHHRKGSVHVWNGEDNAFALQSFSTR